jgi:hypothetical protein
MSPFERYAIDHLSPSSLNLWRASPGLLTARYLAGLKDENAAMWRGHAIGTGLARLFRGGSIGEARSAALDRFDENTAASARPAARTPSAATTFRTFPLDQIASSMRLSVLAAKPR